MYSILIIGGAGFIGSNLTQLLSNHNYNITAVDQFAFEIQPDCKNVSFVQGNITDSNFLALLFRKSKFDIVIHLVSSLIPSSNYSDFNSSRDLNTFSSFELMRQMEENNVKKIIFFSSGGTVYGNNKNDIIREDSRLLPENYYGFSKLLIEEYIQLQFRLNKLKFVIVRPSNPYGNGQKTHSKQGIIAVAMGKLINNEALEIWGDGSVIRDYLHVSDLCMAIYAIIKNDSWNKIYNIGSSEGVSINGIINIIEEVSQKKLIVNYLSSRAEDVPRNVLDTTKIKNDTDWTPKIELRNGLKGLWETLSQKNK